MATHSLSSVVSNLVRAQMGASVPSAVPDNDLDQHVAQLILKEARQKEVRYKGKDGIRAYLSSNDNAPKPNKRFLSTIIKNTDEHNKAILKAQADAALEIKQQREQEEKEERRRRAEEAMNARIRSGSHLSRRSRRHDYDDDRDWRERRENDRRRERTYQDDRGRDSHHKRRRNTDDDCDNDRQRKRRRRDPSEDYDERRDQPRERKRERPLGRDYRSSRRPQESLERGCTRSPGSCEERERRHRDSEHSHRHYNCHHQASSGDGTEERQGRKKTTRKRSASPEQRCMSSTRSGANDKDNTVVEDRTSSPNVSAVSRAIRDSPKSKHHSATRRPRSFDSSEDEIGPTPPPQFSSKMDKYFAADYDPRLDITPVIASDGFLPSGSFEGWDAMLQVIRLRREEKEERKCLGKTSRKGKEKASGEREDIFAIEYTKRGSTREWDEGKKVPT